MFKITIGWKILDSSAAYEKGGLYINVSQHKGQVDYVMSLDKETKKSIQDFEQQKTLSIALLSSFKEQKSSKVFLGYILDAYQLILATSIDFEKEVGMILLSEDFLQLFQELLEVKITEYLSEDVIDTEKEKVDIVETLLKYITTNRESQDFFLLDPIPLQRILDNYKQKTPLSKVLMFPDSKKDSLPLPHVADRSQHVHDVMNHSLDFRYITAVINSDDKIKDKISECLTFIVTKIDKMDTHEEVVAYFVWLKALLIKMLDVDNREDFWYIQMIHEFILGLCYQIKQTFYEWFDQTTLDILNDILDINFTQYLNYNDIDFLRRYQDSVRYYTSLHWLMRADSDLIFLGIMKDKIVSSFIEQCNMFVSWNKYQELLSLVSYESRFKENMAISRFKPIVTELTDRLLKESDASIQGNLYKIIDAISKIFASKRDPFFEDIFYNIYSVYIPPEEKPFTEEPIINDGVLPFSES